MAQPIDRIHYYTPAEYLALEDTADFRSEYYDGEIFAMAGGSDVHNIITGNIYLALRVAFRGKPCVTYISDMKVRVNSKKFFTYPDISVVCGERKFAEGRTDIITNRTLIVEVSSPSTYKYDRTDKFKLFSALDTLQQYVLIDQKRVFIEVFHRDNHNSEWKYQAYYEINTILKLESVNFETAIANIYNNVVFSSPRRHKLVINHPRVSK